MNSHQSAKEKYKKLLHDHCLSLTELFKQLNVTSKVSTRQNKLIEAKRKTSLCKRSKSCVSRLYNDALRRMGNRQRIEVENKKMLQTMSVSTDRYSKRNSFNKSVGHLPSFLESSQTRPRFSLLIQRQKNKDGMLKTIDNPRVTFTLRSIKEKLKASPNKYKGKIASTHSEKKASKSKPKIKPKHTSHERNSYIAKLVKKILYQSKKPNHTKQQTIKDKRMTVSLVQVSPAKGEEM